MPTTDTIATKDKGRWQGWHAFRRGLATKSSRARNPGPHHPGHPAALLSAGDAAGLHQEDPRALRSRHAEVRGKAGLASDSVDVWAGEVWPGPAFGRAFFFIRGFDAPAQCVRSRFFAIYTILSGLPTNRDDPLRDGTTDRDTFNPIRIYR